MEKNGDEMARELRMRLVREVAAPTAQAKDMSWQFQSFREQIGALEKENGEFSNSIIFELKTCAEKSQLMEKGAEIEKRYNDYLQKYEKEKLAMELKRKQLEDEINTLNRKAWESLMGITNEVVAGNYGRGILVPHFNTSEIVRVIGVFDEFNENTVRWAVCLKSRIQISSDDVKRVAEICEQGQPPLFHVSTTIMPLTEEEIKSFCREVDDYWFLKKNISENRIPWDLGYVYRIDTRSTGVEKSRMYMVMLGHREAVFVNMEIGVFPCRSLTILGKINVKDHEKLEKIFDYVLNWLGKEKFPMDLENIPEMIMDASADLLAYSILIHHAFDNLPGIIVHMPQLEK